MLTNTQGERVVNRSTTEATFAGPPLIAVGPSMGDAASAKWAYLRDVVAPRLRDCPLIGFTAEPPPAFDGMLRTLACFSDASRRRPFVWTDARPPQLQLALCGPILAMPDGDGDTPTYNARAVAVALARRWHRADQNHPYRHGMHAIFPQARNGLFGPPVYKVSHTNWKADLDAITAAWLKGGEATVQDVAALRTLEAEGFVGITRHVSPFLVRWLLLEFF